MDREEAQRLVETYGDAVYRLAYAHTGNRADAEDVTQETFLRLVRSLPDFQSEAHCKAWLLRVAVNCAGDLHRSPWRRRTTPLEEAGDLPAPETPEPGGLLEAVSSLPERYRAVVHLYYYEDLSAEEIARLLGKSVNAIYTRLSRARVMLRDSLKEVEGYDSRSV